MRISLWISGFMVAVIAVALVGYHLGAGRAADETLAISLSSQRAYLSKRFEAAYTSEPAIVAIWEGTNLIAFHAKNPPTSGVATKEEAAELLYLNARLSALFNELGNTNEAARFAEATREWFCQISPGSTNNSLSVVRQTLEHDRLKRK